jgi:hypothetical protein
MSRKEAVDALVEAVNAIVRKRNAMLLEKWDEDAGWAVLQGKQKYIAQPPMTKTYTKRHINQVVNIARKQGNMGELIEAAGYRAIK